MEVAVASLYNVQVHTVTIFSKSFLTILLAFKPVASEWVIGANTHRSSSTDGFLVRGQEK